jgi:hypothetical protein
VDNGTRVIHEAKPLWVYNDVCGSMSLKKLKFLANNIEGGWYEQEGTYRTFDPFFVGEEKSELIIRISKHLRKELSRAQKEVDHINKRLKDIGN